MRFDTRSLVLDVSSLAMGMNHGEFELPMKEVEWNIDEVEPEGKHGVLFLSLDLREGILTCSGRLDALFVTPCARCLRPAAFHVEEEIARTYSWKGPGDGGDYEAMISTGLVNLLDAVREAVILSVPGKPLCRPDCPGMEYGG